MPEGSDEKFWEWGRCFGIMDSGRFNSEKSRKEILFNVLQLKVGFVRQC